jgi:hypothetical protein
MTLCLTESQLSQHVYHATDIPQPCTTRIGCAHPGEAGKGHHSHDRQPAVATCMRTRRTAAQQRCAHNQH